MNERNYYEVLGVKSDASSEDIEKAYHELALKWHPDRNPNNREKAEEKFKEINKAYTVLSNPNEREKYNLYGQNAGSYQTGEEGFEGFSNGNSSVFEDILKSFFGGGSQRRKNNSSENDFRLRKGEDILIELILNFKESILGTVRQINLELDKACSHCQQTGAYSTKHITKCSTCKGRGVVNVAQRSFFGETIYSQATCPNCYGKGQIITKKCDYCSGHKFIKQKEIIRIEIPRGIKPNKQLRMRQAANDGWYGGERGDLYIDIRVKDHSYYQREGNNIQVNLVISFLDAILGNQVQVITLEGLETIRVPAGTQYGHSYFLKSRGCYLGIGKSTRGDFLINFQIELPKKITKETEEELKRIEQRSDWNPNRDFIEKNRNILKE